MSFKNGDLVWAKMKGFPPWPGLVCHPPDGLMEGTLFKKDIDYFCIFFFGTHNYGFIEQNQLKAYLPYKKMMSKMAKSAKFKQACLEIEEHYQKYEAPEEKVSEKELINDKDRIEREIKGSVIEGEGICNLYPMIRLHKLPGIEDFLPFPVIPKNENGDNKRILSSPDNSPKKKKINTFSDPDTTTPLDVMCQSSFNNTTEKLSKDQTSIHSPDELSVEGPLSEEEDEEDINNDSIDGATDTSSDSDVPPANKIGFIGLGVMGRILVRKLLDGGAELVIWNRSPEKTTEFQDLDVAIASSPAEVVLSSKIIFCCVSDGTAVKNVVFGYEGVLLNMTPEKSFVDLSSSDVQSSLDIYEAFYSMGCRYLEIRLHGSKKEAEEGTLVCLAAGDESLHNDCKFFYDSCSKQSLFMGEPGNASKFYLVIQSMAGVALAGLAECMALADRAGLDQTDLLNILRISQINCPLIVEKATAMVNNDFSTNLSLRNMQNDLQSVIAVGEDLEQPTPVTATANEIFKHAKKVGYGGHDVSAVFLGSKF